MGSTYLELTNKLLNRFNEVELTSSNFGSRRGVHKAASNYINDALRILNARSYKWPFNEAEGTQVLTVGQNLYDWPSDFKTADMNSFYIEKDDALNVNTRVLTEIPREQWYELGRPRDYDNTTEGITVPSWVFMDSHNKFGVTENPDQAYTVKYKYWVNFIPLSASTDETTVPEEWDTVILDLAEPYMWKFRTNSEQAAQSAKIAESNLNSMRELLVNDEFLVHVNVNNRRYHGAHYYQGRS